MWRLLQTIALGIGMIAVATAPAAAQTTHVVRLIADAGKDDYRFEPASLTVRPNDVIVFRATAGAPHSIVFEGEGLSHVVTPLIV